MGRLRVVVLMLLASASAHSQDRLEWNPPDRYDGPYSGRLIERRLPQHQVPDACRKLWTSYGLDWGVSPRQRGCSVVMKGVCTVIYIDKPYRGTEPSAVRRHELGHCNGWPADHPSDDLLLPPRSTPVG